MEGKKIISFRDLDVYKNTYAACLTVHKRILPLIPEREKFNLYDQLNRSSQAIPRLIAEGYAKRHQRAGFQKYLDDSLAECNETIVSLEQVRDLYNCNSSECNNLIDIYEIAGRQIYRLREAWTKFAR